MDAMTRALTNITLDEQRELRRQRIEDKIIEFLTHGDHRMTEVAAMIGLRDKATKIHLARLAYEGKIHVCRWEEIPVAQRYRAIYRAGKADNAPFPRGDNESPLYKEIAAYVAKHNPGNEDEFKRPPTVVVVRRDPLVEALFGKAA